LVPVDQGDLRDSIAVSTKLTRCQRSRQRKFAPDDIEVFVGAGPHTHMHMQEFGTEHNPPAAVHAPGLRDGKGRRAGGPQAGPLNGDR